MVEIRSWETFHRNRTVKMSVTDRAREVLAGLGDRWELGAKDQEDLK